MHATREHRLDALLRPRSIAIVGASGREGSFGKQLRLSIESLGYEGEVFLINPKYEQIDGLPAYPSLAALPHPVDCVAMAIADKALPHNLELAAAAQARSALMFGRAYGAADDGRELMPTLSAIAQAGNMQLCGANCMGYVNLEDRLQMTGFPFSTLSEPGHVALVSHSGSTWSGIVGNLRQLRFNYAISAGQELVTGVADYIDFLVDQPSTRVICLVLETVRQPEAFLAALGRARAQGIAVIALKLGRSAQGQVFAQSHSGAMSGSADVYDAIFERHGVVSVRTLDELMDTAELFAAARRPHNGSIGLGCDSGGERQLIADVAEPLGLSFAPLSQATVTRLEGLLDPGIEVANPLDYWGDGNDIIADALLALASDEGVGTVVMATNIPDGQDFTNACTAALEKTYAGTSKPVVLMGNVANTMSPTECARYRAAGIPVLMGTETALRALRHYTRYHDRLAASAEHAPALVAPSVPAAVTERWLKRLQQAAQTQTSVQDFDLLRDFGVSVPASLSTADLAQALDFANATGYPLVAKIDSPDIAHKSDMGGVILGIHNEQALREALNRLHAIAPGPVLLQQQLQGSEWILGMKQDPQFGPTFTFGCGGIFVEILKDYTTLLPQDSVAQIRQKIQSLKAYPLLAGARGRAVTDAAQLAAVVHAFMRMGLALQSGVAEMEINPLLVDGHRIAAVDLLVIPLSEDNT
ncbi:acetate--CoA ligase family protein [Limnohabitans sp.]|uniref:acetate--CoA ligase family protein n=1 Tax=Limnohabitans sp. TaxID=1907725 RepID=UPI0025C0F95B|nr:acetate--CoA ligase family protein [Limnohabitans sp.]